MLTILLFQVHCSCFIQFWLLIFHANNAVECSREISEHTFDVFYTYITERVSILCKYFKFFDRHALDHLLCMKCLRDLNLKFKKWWWKKAWEKGEFGEKQCDEAGWREGEAKLKMILKWVNILCKDCVFKLYCLNRICIIWLTTFQYGFSRTVQRSHKHVSPKATNSTSDFQAERNTLFFQAQEISLTLEQPLNFN